MDIGEGQRRRDRPEEGSARFRRPPETGLVAHAGDQVAPLDDLDRDAGQAHVEAGTLREEHLVARLDPGRVGSDLDHDPRAAAGLGARRDDQPAPGLGLLVDRLDDHEVVERLERDGEALSLFHTADCRPTAGAKRGATGKGRPPSNSGACMRRVVITGMGAVTPLGNDVASTWDGAVSGRSGVDFIRAFDSSEYPVHIAAEVKDFEPEGLVPAKEMKRLDRFILFALSAAKEALGDAGINGYSADRVGVVLGSGIGGLNELLRQYDVLRERGPDRVSPTFLPNVLPDSASGQVAIALGIRGPNYAVVSACATGSHAIGEGAELVRRGAADAVLAGGTEGCIHPLFFAGFCSMRGLVAEEENPAVACRPFDASRAGFVMGEGAGVVMLEELEYARARGATIYAEVLGYGASNDAYHMAAPDPDSVAVAEMMRAALAHAKIDPKRVGYVNAHGTSTPLGDAAETKAIKDVFGDHAYELAVSSTKSTMGHLLGAAGAVEAIMTTLAIYHRLVPPTINYRNPDPACDLDYVPNEARPVEIGRAAHGVRQPGVRLAYRLEQLVEGLVLVQTAADLVHGVGVARHRPHRPAEDRGLDAPRGGVVEVEEVHQHVAGLPAIDPRAGRAARALEPGEGVLHHAVEIGEQRVLRGRRAHGRLRDGPVMRAAAAGSRGSCARAARPGRRRRTGARRGGRRRARTPAGARGSSPRRPRGSPGRARSPRRGPRSSPRRSGAARPRRSARRGRR